ncbi:hypothetical protein [Pseudonocardia sediminis]|nr:hypothetical protein [Pseudonocardia sediminis]
MDASSGPRRTRGGAEGGAIASYALVGMLVGSSTTRSSTSATRPVACWRR